MATRLEEAVVGDVDVMFSSKMTEQPEDVWLESNQATGLIIRLHSLSEFRLIFLSVLDHQGKAEVARRVFTKSNPVEFVEIETGSFQCKPQTVKQLLVSLYSKGIPEIKDFFDEEDLCLDGISLDFKVRDGQGNQYQASLFNWESAKDKRLRQIGKYLYGLARSSLKTIKLRVFLMWLW